MIDGIIRINEGDPPTTVTLTPTVPISCPPCTMTVNLVSYVGLKVSQCSVTFSTFDSVMASKTIMMEAVQTSSSFSRVVKIVYSSIIPYYPGSPWDNYTPDYCVVSILLHISSLIACILYSKTCRRR